MFKSEFWHVKEQEEARTSKPYKNWVGIEMKLENTMQLLWMQTVLSSCSYVFLKLGWQLPLGAGCATLCTQFMIAFRAPVKKNVVVLSGRRRPVNLITQPTDNGDISKDTEKVREIIQRLTDTWSYMRAHRLVKTLVQCIRCMDVIIMGSLEPTNF